MTLPGTVIACVPTVLAAGPTVLAVGSVVALGATRAGFFPAVVALGSTPSCPMPVALGLILALGDIEPMLGMVAADGPTPPTA